MRTVCRVKLVSARFRMHALHLSRRRGPFAHPHVLEATLIVLCWCASCGAASALSCYAYLGFTLQQLGHRLSSCMSTR